MDPHFLALMSMKVTAIFDLNTKFKGTYLSSELTNHILSNLLSIKFTFHSKFPVVQCTIVI